MFFSLRSTRYRRHCQQDHPFALPPLSSASLSFLLLFFPIFLVFNSDEHLASDGKHSGHASGRCRPSRRPRLAPRRLQRGSIHPNVSLFHNKIVMRCPDWLGSLEGSHNAPGACPHQHSRGESEKETQNMRVKARKGEGERERVRVKKAEREKGRTRHIGSLLSHIRRLSLCK